MVLCGDLIFSLHVLFADQNALNEFNFLLEGEGSVVERGVGQVSIEEVEQDLILEDETSTDLCATRGGKSPVVEVQDDDDNLPSSCQLHSSQGHPSYLVQLPEDEHQVYDIAASPFKY